MQIGPGKEKFVFPGQQPLDLEADVSNEVVPPRLLLRQLDKTLNVYGLAV